MKRRTFVIEKRELLSASLCRELRVTSAEAVTLITLGAVYVQGRRMINAEGEVDAGNIVTAVISESGQNFDVVANKVELEKSNVIFEDDQVIAINKPAGLNTQAPESGRGSNLWDLVKELTGIEVGLVHRLDKDTTGVVVFGKNKASTAELAQAFRDRQTQKLYLAILSGNCEQQGTITHRLMKDSSRPGRWKAVEGRMGVEAVTHYQRLDEDGPFAAVQLNPETGRTHQLRVHMAAIGCPILGDGLYGGAVDGVQSRCLLHAYRLSVLTYEFKVNPPDDMKPYLRKSLPGLTADSSPRQSQNQ